MGLPMRPLTYAIAVVFTVVAGHPSEPSRPNLDHQHRLPGTQGQKGFGPLRFRADGTFHVSIFEDLHFGENAWDAWGPQQDVQSVKVINTVLDSEPDIDLVVLNGDLITGDNTFLENSTDYVDQIVRPFADRGLTWASTYGNHDNHFNISGAHILERERRWPNSRTTQMVSIPDAHTGVSNYYLPVYPADCDPDSLSPPCPPKLLLWFFDSRGGFHYQQRDPATGALVPLPNWVDARVVDWFTRTNTDLVSSTTPPGTPTPIPALAFVHIPPDASRTLQARGIHPHREPGIDDDRPLARQAQGWCADGSLPPPSPSSDEEEEGDCEYGGQDAPFLDALASTPGMMALFSGHDHGETWCARWEGLTGEGGEGEGVGEGEVRGGSEGDGLNLCFGQRSGYGGYGRWIRGARQVVVSLEGLAERVVETYIRLESGETVGAVTLNATYGQDWYPATPNDKTRLPTGDD
ncbi:Metallo-dependent phosphatase-like protein [Chaetomium fimeti]|uniref:Metallo-dependent phosphatase-like protein n=1 Tax=Chaetomium fimeti TaxID=1854472 RepID=A0AAE0HN16_9PEZI|nr:Metallo-dependent phosphatase-like protein [Chaetomium fimeti]